MDVFITVELWVSQARCESVALARATRSAVIARSPCDEAIQSASAAGLDCFAALAMTENVAVPLARLRPQIEIALRLQLGQTDHAALLRADEARQEIRERDVLRLHRVAAGGELDAILGEIADALADVRVGLRPVKRLQRRPVDHQCDRHMVRTADAVDVVLDVAK